MPIPGDALKGYQARGFNLIARFVSDMVKGYKGKAGGIKATKEEAMQFANSQGNMANLFGETEKNILKNNELVNQNNLEAFYVAQGRAIKEGDELELKGLDAVRARYYGRRLETPFDKENNLYSGLGDETANIGMMKDARDVAAAAASAVIAFKATWSAVSLLTRND